MSHSIRLRHAALSEIGRLVDMVKCCLNLKVVAGVAVTGAGLWLVAPGMVSAALPLLLLAICPLSMLLMVKMMQGQQQASAPTGIAPEQQEPAPVEIGLSTGALTNALDHARTRSGPGGP